MNATVWMNPNQNVCGMKEARSKRGITPGIDHMLGHITNLNAFKRIERIYSVFYK